MIHNATMKDLKTIRRQVKKNAMHVDDVLLHKKTVFDDFSRGLLGLEADGMPLSDEIIDAMENFLMICLDVYTYSETGGVLVDDHTYDIVMNIWKRCGGAHLQYADTIQNNALWGFQKHEAPFMVGTISNKIYTVDELAMNLEKWQLAGYSRILYAPKFDGVSAAVKWENGKIMSAMTRNDGVKGMDITEVIRLMNNQKHIFTENMPDGYYKCEIVVSTEDFNALCEIKQYANRRSTASAIVSTRSNLPYAIYLTAIPLAWVNFGGTQMQYLAANLLPDQLKCNPKIMDIDFVYSNIETIMHYIRQPSFPFRVDGVVLFPMLTENDSPNLADLMAHCLAYKINTQEAITHVKRVYMSVGRTGLGTPMVEVEPCDVNETVCTSASLGSMDIYSGLHLRRGEEVTIYAAGDVIPQLKRSDVRKYPKNAPILNMDITCPFCGSTLRFKRGSTANIYCLNPQCPRVKSGKIVNFLDKLDACEGFRDKVILKLVDKRIVSSIQDLFNLDKKRDVMVTEIGPVNTDKLLSGINDLQKTEYEISQIIGACGIDGCSINTCRMIFGDYTLDYLMNLDFETLQRRLLNIEGIGTNTADVFANWIFENRDLINFLIQHMNVMDDAITYGNVVFTGFRNKDYVPIFKELGFPVWSGVNKDTVAVVYVGDTTSGNAQKAAKKRLPLIHFTEIDTLVKILKDISQQLNLDPTSYNHDECIRDIKRNLGIFRG